MSSEQKRVRRARRGCLIALMPVWVGLSLATVIGFFFLLGKVERDGDVIARHVATFMEIELPDGFYPFSRNKFMGTEAISFYHRDHLREDGRTTSVISIQKERSWQNLTREELEVRNLSGLVARLASREFTVQEKKSVEVTRGGHSFTIHQFQGRQLMGEEMRDASTCFRFLMGIDGPFQVQAMGLTDNFPPQLQIEALASIRIIR